MKKYWKRNGKKYIAGILTIALAAGICQSYGSMEVSAQERTLPGIEKLVQDTVASADGTYHILEIVPSKSDATIGYLIGGEEPVSEGRKLSELPAASERTNAMTAIAGQVGAGGSLADIVGSNGPVSFSAYSEGSGLSRTEEIRGTFVKNAENNGRYTYVVTDPVYKMLQDGNTTTAERYDRLSTIAAADSSNENKKSVIPTFANVSNNTSGASLEITITDGTETLKALADTRYA